jgi:hypothetical protein
MLFRRLHPIETQEHSKLLASHLEDYQLFPLIVILLLFRIPVRSFPTVSNVTIRYSRISALPSASKYHIFSHDTCYSRTVAHHESTHLPTAAILRTVILWRYISVISTAGRHEDAQVFQATVQVSANGL